MLIWSYLATCSKRRGHGRILCVSLYASDRPCQVGQLRRVFLGREENEDGKTEKGERSCLIKLLLCESGRVDYPYCRI